MCQGLRHQGREGEQPPEAWTTWLFRKGSNLCLSPGTGRPGSDDRTSGSAPGSSSSSSTSRREKIRLENETEPKSDYRYEPDHQNTFENEREKKILDKLNSFDMFDKLESIELLRQDLTLETDLQEPDRILSPWPGPGSCRRASSPTPSPQTSKKIKSKKEEAPQARRASEEEEEDFEVNEMTDSKKTEDSEKKTMTGSMTSTPRLGRGLHHHHCLDTHTGGPYLPSSRPEESPRMTLEGSLLRSSVTTCTLSRSLLGGTASTQGVGRGQELLQTPGISPSCGKFKLANQSFLAVVPRLPHTAVCSATIGWGKDDSRATSARPGDGHKFR